MTKINEVPRGQLSTIILSTLFDGDKYGYEIICDVEKKTNNTISIKKPSLYSSLKRMEEQELISSYWMDSNIGGRRHYYRLTDFGRKQLIKWQEDLIKSQQSVSTYFNNEVNNNSTQLEQKVKNSIVSKEHEDDKSLNFAKKDETFLEQANLFYTNYPSDKKSEEVQNEINKQNAFIQYDLFENKPKFTKPDSKPLSVLESNLKDDNYNFNKIQQDNNSIITSISKDDLVKENIENYNVFNELNKIITKEKSFSASVKNQKLKPDYKSTSLSDFMGEAVVMSEARGFDVKKINGLIYNDEKEDQSYTKESNSNSMIMQTEINTVKEDKEYEILSGLDGAAGNNIIKDPNTKLITEYVELPRTPHTKPSTINFSDLYKHNSNSNMIKKNDKSQDTQDHKDLINELYNKSTLGKNDPGLSTKISNYNNLSSFLKEQNIYFMQYNKNITKKTMLLNDYRYSAVKYLFMLLSLIFTSVISFIIIKTLSYIRPSQLWIYIVVPVFYAIYTSIILYSKSKTRDKKIMSVETEKKSNIFLNVTITLILMIIVYAINISMGLYTFNFNDYTSSLIVPVVFLANAPLINLYSYIAKKFRIVYK